MMNKDVYILLLLQSKGLSVRVVIISKSNKHRRWWCPQSAVCRYKNAPNVSFLHVSRVRTTDDHVICSSSYRTESVRLLSWGDKAGSYQWQARIQCWCV